MCTLCVISICLVVVTNTSQETAQERKGFFWLTEGAVRHSGEITAAGAWAAGHIVSASGKQ